MAMLAASRPCLPPPPLLGALPRDDWHESAAVTSSRDKARKLVRRLTSMCSPVQRGVPVVVLQLDYTLVKLDAAPSYFAPCKTVSIHFFTAHSSTLFCALPRVEASGLAGLISGNLA